MSAYNEGLPQEMKAADLDYSVPEGTRNVNIRVQASNLSSIVSPTAVTGGTAGIIADQAQNQQTIVFDLPAGSSNSYLDCRQTYISFRAVVECVSAGTSANVTSAILRSGAHAHFDRMEVVGPQGQILEGIQEYGLVYDSLINFQQSNSDRDGNALMGGFDPSTSFTSDGHNVYALQGAWVTGQTQTNSYSIPLLSGIIGQTASKFFPIGAVPKLQLQLTTSAILPYSVVLASGSAGTWKVTLTDFILNCEYIQVPARTQAMIEASLHDGKYFLGGTTYRTTSATLAAGVTGFNSVLTGLRASSLKSAFVRFQELNLGTNRMGKYSSKNPIASTIAFNFNGQRYPPLPTEVLLHPSRAMIELFRAFGVFSPTEMTSGITPNKYCVVSVGGIGQSLTNTTQDYNWSTVDDAISQELFMYGSNVECINKKGILGGLNINSSTGFVEMNIAQAPTYAHTVFVMGMLDSICVVDSRSGDCSIRL